MAQFGRQYRILEGRHYKAVFDNRLRYHSRFFSFHLMPNTEAFSRVGIAVSKKVSKRAVERNRIKRQIRDSFRHYLQTELQNNSENHYGTDFVVVAKSTANGSENADMRKELDDSWGKALASAKTAGHRPRRNNGRGNTMAAGS